MSSTITWENSTHNGNSSNVTFILSGYYLDALLVALTTTDAFFAFAGTILNIWFLLAILKSRVLRSSMRNKIICHLLIVQLTETMILCPIWIGDSVVFLLNKPTSTYCYYMFIFFILYDILEMVANWLLVILVSVFLAQETNFNLKLQRRCTILFTSFILAAPWVAGFLLVPAIFKSLYLGSCHFDFEGIAKILKSLDTIVPLTVSIVVLLVAVIWRRSRSPSRHYSGNIRAQLLEGGPSLDPVKAYVALVVIAVLCETPLRVINVSPVYSRLEDLTWWILYTIFAFVATSRVIWSTLSLLLFPDIRARIRTWRPWARWSTQTDLVISYKKDSA